MTSLLASTTTSLANVTGANSSQHGDDAAQQPDALMNYLLSTVVFFLMCGVGMLLNFKMLKVMFHCAVPDDDVTLAAASSAVVATAGKQQQQQQRDRERHLANEKEKEKEQREEKEEGEEEASPRILMSRKSWRPLLACVIGVSCQILITPIVGVVLAMSFDMSPWERFGCVAVACVPGGAISNPIAVITHGVVELSVTMTVISSVLSFVSAPLNLLWTTHVVGVPSGAVDFGALAIGFAFLLAPLLIGVTANVYLSKKAKKIFGIACGIGSGLGIVAVITVVLGGFAPSITKNVIQGASWKVFVAASVVNFPSMALLSYGLVALAGFRPAIRRTVSVESLQNVAIAYAVLQLGLRNATTAQRTAAYTYAVIFSLAQYIWIALIIVFFRLLKKRNDANGVIDVDPDFVVDDDDDDDDDRGDSAQVDNTATVVSAHRANNNTNISAVSLAPAPQRGACETSLLVGNSKNT